MTRWEYNTVAMARAQKMIDVYEMLEKAIKDGSLFAFSTNHLTEAWRIIGTRASSY
jgi:hypothetical protein